MVPQNVIYKILNLRQDTTDYGDFLDQSNFFFSRFQEEIK